MKKSLLLIAASCLLTVSSAMAQDTTADTFFTGDKTWHWKPTSVNGGAVWGNGGYQAGPQTDDGSINGAWWGCGTVDGECFQTFTEYLDQSSNDALTGDEYSTSYMVFKSDGSLEKYDKDGNLLNTGEYSITNWTGLPGYDNTYGRLKTSAGAILWPFQINSNGYQPEEFEISYISSERLILSYATEGTGSWGECTWWSFASDDGVGINVDYGKKLTMVNGIRYAYVESTYSAEVVPLEDGKYEGEIEIPDYIETPNVGVCYVRGIRENAFADCPNLTKVTINESLNMIGVNSFKGCTGLKEVEVNSFFPDHIGVNSDAFNGVDVSQVKLTVFDGLEKIYSGLDVWRDFMMNPKPFEMEITKQYEKNLEKHYYGFYIRVKDYPSLTLPGTELRFTSSDTDIVKLADNWRYVCLRPGKANIRVQCYNTVAETEIEVLEALKLPTEGDDSYVAELLAEGKDLYFVDYNDYTFYPDENGYFSFDYGYVYSSLPETDETDGIYLITFDARLEPYSVMYSPCEFVMAYINSAEGMPAWAITNLYTHENFYYDELSDTNSYTLTLDPKDYYNFSATGLGIYLNFYAQKMTMSNLKVYKVKQVESIKDIIYTTDAETQYYTLEGIRTLYPQPGHIYIKVQDGKAMKTLYR